MISIKQNICIIVVGITTRKRCGVKNMDDVPGWSCEGVLIPKAEKHISAQLEVLQCYKAVKNFIRNR